MDESKTAFPRLVTGRSQEKACVAESMNSRKKLVAAGPPLGSIRAVVIYISILQAKSPVAEKDWKNSNHIYQNKKQSCCCLGNRNAQVSDEKYCMSLGNCSKKKNLGY